MLEEKNRTGRPFRADEFYAIGEKLTGHDTRPGFSRSSVQQGKNGSTSPDYADYILANSVLYSTLIAELDYATQTDTF